MEEPRQARLDQAVRLSGSSNLADPFTVQEDQILLAVRITPKASRNAIGAVLALPDGRNALSVRIAAPPVDGAANAELIAYMAKALAISRSAVTIRSGATGRLKIIELKGDVAAIADALRAATAADRD